MRDSNDKKIIESLTLFRSLITEGCEWHGDIISKKWADCLYMPNAYVEERAKRTLAGYVEGVDYIIKDNEVWIA